MSTGALSDAARVEELIKQCNNLGPLHGIFVSLEDSPENPDGSLPSLIANLDGVTRKLCSAIRFASRFVFIVVIQLNRKG